MIRTERLILREWRDSDLEPFASMNADPRVMEYFPSVLSRAESDAMIARVRANFLEDGFGFFATEHAGMFIGFIGLSRPKTFTAHFMPCVEIGWRLAYDHWGKGYAREGAIASLRFGFDELGLSEIVSFTTVTNTRSRNVMTKIGMQHDPADDFDHSKVPLGHVLRPHVLYRLRAKDWSARLSTP